MGTVSTAPRVNTTGDRTAVPASFPHVSRIQPPFRPILEVTPEYSKVPMERAFNWGEAFARTENGEWYLVAFRSKHRADADHDFLTWLDERASSAASRHPGFMYYFIGAPMDDGSCLSFCLWHSRDEAVAAASDPEHQEAMILGLPCFDHYRLERYLVRKHDGHVSIQVLEAPRSSPFGESGAVGMSDAGARSGSHDVPVAYLHGSGAA